MIIEENEIEKLAKKIDDKLYDLDCYSAGSMRGEDSSCIVIKKFIMSFLEEMNLVDKKKKE